MSKSWYYVPPDIEEWHEEGFEVHEDAPGQPVICRDCRNEETACLLTAAPDLLEAAKEGAQVILELLQGKDPGELGLHEALVTLQEAVEKAEGNA